MRACVPSTVCIARRVAVAMPDARCIRFSAVRSPIRMEAAFPLISGNDVALFKQVAVRLLLDKGDLAADKLERSPGDVDAAEDAAFLCAENAGGGRIAGDRDVGRDVAERRVLL